VNNYIAYAEACAPGQAAAAQPCDGSVRLQRLPTASPNSNLMSCNVQIVSTQWLYLVTPPPRPGPAAAARASSGADCSAARLSFRRQASAAAGSRAAYMRGALAPSC